VAISLVVSVCVVSLVVMMMVVEDWLVLWPRLVDGDVDWLGDGDLDGNGDLLLVDDGLSLLEEGDGEGEGEGYREQVLLPVEEEEGANLFGQHELLPVAQFK
jgi:hypothetical protein